MRIAVMGAGGVGGYFGGLLARAGNRVTLIARGAHLQAIQRLGLRVKRQWDEFNVNVEAKDDPSKVDPVDLVLFTVKTYHNTSAIPAMRPLVGEATSVLTLQNGVESFQELAKVFGRNQLLPGAAYIETHIEAPGIITQRGEVVRIVFGEYDGKETPRAKRILETLQNAGIETELSKDILKTLWTKFLFITTLAGITSVARAPMYQLLHHPEAREMILATMLEVEAVGRANGVNLDSDVVERTIEYIESAAQDLKASMHTDLEQGRPLELEALNGAVVRIGQQLGVPTPVNQFLYSILKVHRDGAI